MAQQTKEPFQETELKENKNEEKRISIGIDLGTTYCCVAYMNKDENENNKLSIIKIEDGKDTFPSNIAYSKKE